MKTLNAILGLEALASKEELRQRQDLKRLVLKTMEENEIVIAKATRQDPNPTSINLVWNKNYLEYTHLCPSVFAIFHLCMNTR